MDQVFTPDFFVGNRRRLYAQLEPNSLLILTAYGQMQRSDDSAFPFAQEANFWYLTGIEEANWRLLVDMDSGREYLIAPRRTTYQDIFDGALTPEQIMQMSGVDEVLEHVAGSQLLTRLLTTKQVAYTLSPRSRTVDGFYTNPAQRDLLHTLRGVHVTDVRPFLERLRAIKQPAEIEVIRQATTITIAGIEAVVRQLPSLTYEYEAEAILTYEFRRRGATGHAFEPIVAGGSNACTLHYVRNTQRLTAGSLLVLDVGAEFAHYAADITRTISIGEPSERQKAVLIAVTRVHDAAIALCQPGKSIKEYDAEVEAILYEELVHLGLLTRKSRRRDVYNWMPHAIGHSLGIEVHDTPLHSETLQAGMLLTVEPGIYIPQEGLGVRIEDDILIDVSGPQILSGHLPVNPTPQS